MDEMDGFVCPRCGRGEVLQDGLYFYLVNERDEDGELIPTDNCPVCGEWLLWYELDGGGGPLAFWGEG